MQSPGKSFDDQFGPTPEKLKKHEDDRPKLPRQMSRSFLRQPSSTSLAAHTSGAHTLQADILTGQDVRKNRILLLYTGGAQGWKKVHGGFEHEKNLLLKELRKLPTMHDEKYVTKVESDIFDDLPGEDVIGPDTLVMPISRYGVRVFIDVREMKECDIVKNSKDSLGISDWVHIAAAIEEQYDGYFGFVILHGTDTMSYTASALSFMFENLGKSVILTGSQVALNNHLSDGRANLLGAVMLAGHHVLPEVTLFFHGKLYRGNRSLKVDARSFGGFDSPNFPPLARVEGDIDIEWEEIFPMNQASKFTVHTKLSPHIGVLRIFPNITLETVQSFLQPPIQGIVLETYGAGNGPDSRPDILEVIAMAAARGVIIMNCTQCLYGHVIDSYASGRVLTQAGVISAWDMTVEAALAKLAYVLGKEELTLHEKKELMKTNLRGEMTPLTEEKHQFSLRENELINVVASNLKVGSAEEVRYIKKALFPILMCFAARAADMDALEEFCRQGGSPSIATEHDGRTPLHVACLEGHVEIVRYLLLRGASPHVRDKYGQSPLDDAIKGRHDEVIKYLREIGAHMGPTTTEAALELCSLAAQNNVDRLRAWYLAGADLSAGDYDKRTPLHVACCRNNIEIVKYLLESEADMDLKDFYGETPLDNAVHFKHWEIVKLLKDFKMQRQIEKDKQ